MAWYCADCGAKQADDHRFCGSCGGHRPAEDEAPDSGAAGSRSGVKDVSRGLWDDLRSTKRGGLDDLKTEMKESLADLRRGSPDSTHGRSSVRDGLRREARGVLDDTRGVRQGRGGPPADPGPGSLRPNVVPGRFERVMARDLEVDVDFLPRLNFALDHGGFPLVRRMVLRNLSGEPAHDVLVKLWVASDFGEPWTRTIPSIAIGEAADLGPIRVPLRKERLQAVRETERGYLKIEVSVDGRPVYADTRDMEVLAYNEWYYHPDHPETTASFIQPNSPAVKEILTAVRDRLRDKGSSPDLSGYQSGDVERVRAMVEALYEVLQSHFRITYINPPPSFEGFQSLPDGSLSIHQKVRFGEEILEHTRGTCLDLALLCCGCLEAMGLNPLLFLVPGHAFWGLWLVDQGMPAPNTTDVDGVLELVRDEVWLALNSTTFTGGGRGFEECRREALHCLQGVGPAPPIFGVVDVNAARRSGVKPIPPMG